MNLRALGSSGLEVSVLGFGCAAIGSRVDKRAAKTAIAHALECGINYFDTAPFYGQGESESILGTVLKTHSNKVVVSTKVGLVPSRSLQMLATFKPIVRKVLSTLPGSTRGLMQRRVQGVLHKSAKVSLDPKAIESSVDASLRRLQREAIDILFLHATPNKDQLPDILGVLLKLKKAGKVRSIGAGAVGVIETNAWLEEPIDVLQVRLNLLETAVIKACLPKAIEHGVGIVAREPFAHGRLIPKTIHNPSPEGLDFVGESLDNRFEFLNEMGGSLTEAAIRFLTHTPGIHSVLTGMTKIAHVDSNVTAIYQPQLHANQLQRIYSI